MDQLIECRRSLIAEHGSRIHWFILLLFVSLVDVEWEENGGFLLREGMY